MAALRAAGLPAEQHAHVGEQVWAKLALAVMSPVSAVLGATVAAVWRSAEGVRLDRDRSWAHARAVVEGTGEHRTSTCSDVPAGTRTELASMAGAVRDLARRHGVPVPVHPVVLGLMGATGVR